MTDAHVWTPEPQAKEKKKTRTDCVFRRQFNEKPSIIPGCSGTRASSLPVGGGKPGGLEVSRLATQDVKSVTSYLEPDRLTMRSSHSSPVLPAVLAAGSSAHPGVCHAAAAEQ